MGENVIVLDADKRFLEYTHPAAARKLLKEEKAIVYSREPFAIQLSRAVEAPDRNRRNQEMGIVNFTEFFKEERDIYIQNISNCQVSVSFDLGGHSESFLFPNSKDPVNLTRFIPFAAVKGSMDLRRMLNRSPQALNLLKEEEYKMYFERQSQQLGLSGPDAAIDRAEAARMAVQNHTTLPNAPDPIKLHEVVEDGSHMGEKKLVRSLDSVSEVDEITPRVLNLCLQVHQSVSDQSKMTAQQLLTELDSTNGLTLADWEYIQSHGYYKSVKNLARRKVAEMASAHEAADSADEQEEAPRPAKKAPARSKAAKSAVTE